MTKTRDRQMEEPMVMYQEGPAISGGPITARLLRSETRKNILENYNPGILVKELHYRIRLNRGFRTDWEWWACLESSGYDVKGAASGSAGTITWDASGSWRCMVFSHLGETGSS